MIKIKWAIVASLTLLMASCTKDNAHVQTSAADTTAVATTPIRIAAAANLSDVLPNIIDGYEAELKTNNLPEQNIEVTYASSGKLYAQIKAGAPYDIFLSANQSFPATLVKDTSDSNSAGKKYGNPFTYTQGQLAFYSTTKTLENLNPISLAELLAAQTTSKITIASPELAPYGESAKVYLQSQNIYDSLVAQKRLIQAENIGQAFQYTDTGSVDYGFVAQSQLVAAKTDSKQFYTLPIASYPAILQDGIILGDNPVATSFANYLQSPVAQQYFTQAGYLAVQ